MRSCISRRNIFKTFALILGASSMAGQIVLLREAVSVFYGNEMVYAVILAVWLFWVGLGSAVAGRIFLERKKLKRVALSVSAAVALLLPGTVFVLRIFKNFLNVSPGEMVGLSAAAVGSFLVLAPLTFLLGMLFALLCRWAEEERTVSAAAVIYFWEAAGSAISGILITLVLLKIFSGLKIVILLSLVSLFQVSLAVFHRHRDKVSLSFWIIVFLMIVPMDAADWLDHFSRRLQWPGFDVVANRDSVYGNITVLKRGDDYSLYENGLLNFTAGDELASEERIHFTMLSHSQPKRVLLIGGGVGGGLKELLKYKEARIDYVELDSAIVEVSQEVLPEGFLGPLYDERVDVYYQDGRRFVKTTDRRYDVIILGLPDPATAALNRFYTRDFFIETKRILNTDGVLSLAVSSSANYLNEETRSYLRSLHTTLKNVFSEVVAVPGDTHIFLASVQPNRLTLDPAVLAQRLKERMILNRFVSEHTLSYRLESGRVREIDRILSVPGRINSDSQPITYFYSIIHWSTHFHEGFKRLIQRLEWLRSGHLIVIPGLVFVFGWLWPRRSRNRTVSLSIMATGFSEILFQLVVILAFQTLYGYVYYRLGLIFAGFMLGLVLGSWAARLILHGAPQRSFDFYLATQSGIVIYPLFLPLTFVLFRDMMMTPVLLKLFSGVFVILPVVAGFMGGLQYPLATRLLKEGQPGDADQSRQAGWLYAVDVFGAAVGALLTGTILVPLLGITAVAWLCAGVNLAVLILLIMSQGQEVKRSRG